MQEQRRRTKIIATLGPASASKETIGRLLGAGVDIFRLNSSHGTHAFYTECIKFARACAAERKRTVGILQDLQGPKIRVGNLEGHEPVELVADSEVRISILKAIAVGRDESALDEMSWSAGAVGSLRRGVDLLGLTGAEILGRDRHDAVGIDVERHLDLRHAPWRRRKASREA